MYIRISEDENGSVTVKDENDEYHCFFDEFTGDWAAVHANNSLEIFLKNRDSAIKFCLKRLGVVEDVEIEYAPDRTSA